MSALDIKSLGSDQLAEVAHGSAPPEIVALQAVAIVDHVCGVSMAQLQEAVGGDKELGGSRQIDLDTLSSLLGAPIQLSCIFACLSGYVWKR